MKSWTRRKFVGLGGATLLAAVGPKAARGQAAPRVVVVGGGIGGATVARYLAASADPIDVTLVEPKEHYLTCFFSNLYLAGLRSLDSLSHDYRALAEKSGIKVIHEAATGIDPADKTVSLQSGARLSYDRLVLAPGVAFKFGAIEGYDEAASEVMPHAWNAGPQSKLLRRQLESMEDGGVFLIVVPPDPVPLPAGPLRTRVAGRVLLQAVQAEVEDPDPRRKGCLQAAGCLPGRVGPPLSRHDRVAAETVHRRREGGRRKDPDR